MDAKTDDSLSFDENFDYSLSSLSDEEVEMNCTEDLLLDAFHGRYDAYTEPTTLLPVKAVGQRGTGSKLRQKALRTRGGIDNNAAVNSVMCRKVVKRRSAPHDKAKPILYVFPSFDRSDALLFLPSTFATHINTANFNAMAKMFQTNFDKNCEVESPFGPKSPASLLHFHQLINDMHPDAFFCVHTTKVVENTIHAAVYAKFTASKAIYNAVSRTVKDPLFAPFFGVQRTENFRQVVEMGERTEEEKEEMSRVLSSDADYIMYLRLKLVFTYDDISKMITRYDMGATFTSIEPVACVT